MLRKGRKSHSAARPRHKGHGQRKGLLHLRRSTMEGGAEARHLRQFGIEGECPSDRCEVLRLVQRGERYQPFQRCQQSGVTRAGRE